MGDVTAQDILNEGMVEDDVAREHFPTAIVQVVETIGSDGKPMLWTRRDNQSGVWKHLGMIESAANDIRAALLEAEED